jgi:hypothetical protein
MGCPDDMEHKPDMWRTRKSRQVGGESYEPQFDPPVTTKSQTDGEDTMDAPPVVELEADLLLCLVQRLCEPVRCKNL